MKTLGMIKAIARLEGVDVIEQNGVVICQSPAAHLSLALSDKYNPIAELSLNCALRDKYNVEVAYRYEGCGWVVINHDDGSVTDVNYASGELCKAVIECILKSRGLYE